MSGQSPTPITLLMTVPGNLAAAAEIHEQFKSANHHGEWFSLTAELREDLYARLCPIGKGTLSAAEQEFQHVLSHHRQRRHERLAGYLDGRTACRDAST